MKKKKLWIGIGIVAAILLAFSLLKGKKKEQEIIFEYAKVEKANIQNSITATGTIEPVTSVTVGTQVSGIVNRLYVDYNSVVRKGQVIAELDKTNLLSELNTARANLSSAESALTYQRANFERFKTLYTTYQCRRLRKRTPVVSTTDTTSKPSTRKRKTRTDKPKLCHHHIANRRSRTVKIGRRRTNRSRILQHTRTLQDSTRPHTNAGRCKC